MALEAVIFDVDGTLIDSNDLHATAWQRALCAFGHDLPYERVRAHIGMGGDKLVPALTGKDPDEALEKRHTEEYFALLDDPSVPKRVFACVRELLDDLRERKLRVAIATSGEREHFERAARAFGIELADLVDEVVTASGSDESKPAPDLVCSALEALRVDASSALMVGDTPYDANACRAASVACIAVRSGGWSDAILCAAGAALSLRDTGELHARRSELLSGEPVARRPR